MPHRQRDALSATKAALQRRVSAGHLSAAEAARLLLYVENEIADSADHSAVWRGHGVGMAPGEFYSADPGRLRAAGYTHVRLHVSPEDGHPDCFETYGFTLPIESALRLRPLPHDLPGGHVCRCVFVPVARA